MAQTLDIAGGQRTVRRTRKPGRVRDIQLNGSAPETFSATSARTGLPRSWAPASWPTRAAVLPLRLPGLRVFATVVWALAAAWLIALTAAFAVHWARYPDRARGHAAHPVMAQFWGAPAMALMTVGAGTLVLGRGLLGRPRSAPTGCCGWPGRRSAWSPRSGSRT